MHRKRELTAAADVKRAEITAAVRIAREGALAAFLKTAARPAVLWLPQKHCPDTELLAAQRQQDFEAFAVRMAPFSFIISALICKRSFPPSRVVDHRCSAPYQRNQ